MPREVSATTKSGSAAMVNRNAAAVQRIFNAHAAASGGVSSRASQRKPPTWQHPEPLHTGQGGRLSDAAHENNQNRLARELHNQRLREDQYCEARPEWFAPRQRAAGLGEGECGAEEGRSLSRFSLGKQIAAHNVVIPETHKSRLQLAYKDNQFFVLRACSRKARRMQNPKDDRVRQLDTWAAAAQGSAAEPQLQGAVDPVDVEEIREKTRQARSSYFVWKHESSMPLRRVLDPYLSLTPAQVDLSHPRLPNRKVVQRLLEEQQGEWVLNNCHRQQMLDGEPVMTRIMRGDFHLDKFRVRKAPPVARGRTNCAVHRCTCSCVCACHHRGGSPRGRSIPGAAVTP